MKKTLIWLVIDIVLLLLFAFQGRSAHAQSQSLMSLLDTAWPFLVGLAIGWLATRQWRTTEGGLPVALQIWPSALVLAVVTWAAGLLLRTLSGDTNSGGFPWVALGFILLMLVGWRIVWGSVLRIRAKRELTAQ